GALPRQDRPDHLPQTHLCYPQILLRSQKSFAWFEMMGRSSSNRVIPNLINKSANSIQADMDKATALYAHANK
ncbi:hypothetical protein, partial [Thiolapillus sp.]|uniref:hypothetical protein n=1 Tax=Thiolapillus sp. TaxID=2017437 RepID=UPI003AF8CF69